MNNKTIKIRSLFTGPKRSEYNHIYFTNSKLIAICLGFAATHKFNCQQLYNLLSFLQSKIANRLLID